MHSHTKALIIGQGLAGTALAWQLCQQGVPFILVDEHLPDTSSKVAAGLITPITGMRLNLGWRIAELIPYAQSFYQTIEQKLHTSFYHETPHVRLFKDAREVQLWQKRRLDPTFSAWLDANENVANPSTFHAELNGFQQRGSAWLDTSTYLSASHEFFSEQHCWQQGTINPTDLTITNHQIGWKDTSFSHVIFCQGWQAQHNPWFSSLPFHSARGVIATLSSPNLITPRHIYNRSGWISPQLDNNWRTGSTYEFDFNRPLQSSLEDIHQKLSQLLKIPFTLSDPKAAIRPIIKNRHAVIGSHPTYRNFAIFNGLGSKGAMKAPLLAHWLSQHLFDQQPLHAEVDFCSNF